MRCLPPPPSAQPPPARAGGRRGRRGLAARGGRRGWQAGFWIQGWWGGGSGGSEGTLSREPASRGGGGVSHSPPVRLHTSPCRWRPQAQARGWKRRLGAPTPRACAPLSAGPAAAGATAAEPARSSTGGSSRGRRARRSPVLAGSTQRSRAAPLRGQGRDREGAHLAQPAEDFRVGQRALGGVLTKSGSERAQVPAGAKSAGARPHGGRGCGP